MYRAPLIFGVVILLLILGVIWLFGGNNGGKTSKTPHSQIQPLPNYAGTDAQVSMTIDGPITGDDTHRAIKITVSQNERDLDIIQGYSGYVIKHQQFYNTQNAYSVFLKAINIGGFLEQRKDTSASLDDSGQCPLGERFVFELNNSGSKLSSLWTSNCSTAVGNFGGDSGLVQTLFQNQITNYQALTQNVQF